MRRAARRKVEDGFPILTPFKSIDDVRHYLGGDRVICLLCGRAFRNLGIHLKHLHGMDADAYREKYRIPWTYGLVCEESGQRYSVARINYPPPYGDADRMKTLAMTAHRGCPFSSGFRTKNLGSFAKKRSVKPETIRRRGRQPIPKGTPEYHEMMSRVAKQTAAKTGAAERMRKVGSSGKGVPKSPEHRAKLAAILARCREARR